MKEEKDPVIVKFARTVKEAVSYEEFFLVCMADDTETFEGPGIS